MGGSDASPDPVTTRLTDIREDLLGGRGPGASEDEILAATRNRVEVAGMTATRRLELAARQTGRARGDADAVDDAMQLHAAEEAHDVDEDTGRLRPRIASSNSLHTSRSVLSERSTAVGLVGAVAVWVVTVWVLRRRSRR